MAKHFLILTCILGLLTITLMNIHTGIIYAQSGAATSLNNACNTSADTKNNPYCAAQDKTVAGNDPITKTIKNVTMIAATIGGILGVIFVIYGGFIYVISQGDPKKTASAIHTIIYALIGLVVIGIGQFVIIFILNNIVK